MSGLIIFFGAIAVVVAIVGAVEHFHRTKATNDAFRAVAERFGGSVTAASLIGNPSLRFQHAGAHVFVDVDSRGGSSDTIYTQFHISYPDRALRCVISPEGFWDRVGKFFGMDDIQVGSPSFDPRYLIQGNLPDEIRQVLSPDVQSRIEALRRFTGIDDIYIQVQGGTLLIKKVGYLREYTTLLAYIVLCTELFDEMVSNVGGITFVDPPVEPQIDGAVCLVCGSEIKGEAVLCRSCKTPHHLECWQYNGSCSTYGCGQKRYVRSKRR